MIILETEHLLFRPLTLSDLDDMAALYSDPEVMRYLGGRRDRNEVERVLNGYIRDYQMYGHSFFATILKSDQSFIGHCGLLNQEVEGQPEMELGYILARPYWQNNLAVEGIQALKEYGFRELGFPRLVSLIPAENSVSIHIAEKIGMQFEHDVNQWGQQFRLYAVQKTERAAQ